MYFSRWLRPVATHVAAKLETAMKFFPYALAVIVALAASAEARQTGWISASQWEAMIPRLRAAGEVPVAVKCRDLNTISLSNASGEANVTLANKPDVDWHWAFGAGYGPVKANVEKNGFRQAAYHSFTRASGLKVPCAVWHKKK